MSFPLTSLASHTSLPPLSFHEAQVATMLSQPIRPVHIGHSSVGVLANGMCIETRRGTQRLFDIPNPSVWSSMQEWIAAIPYTPFDILERALPAHFNTDQIWMAQWHEASTLLEICDMYGNVQVQTAQTPTLLVQDADTGSLVPLYMSLDTGSMYAQGTVFNAFSNAPFTVGPVWRMEGGVYYRVA